MGANPAGSRARLVSSRVATIGVVHIGWPGHMGPANRLSAVLSRRGHRVIGWAPARWGSVIESSGAEHRPLDPHVEQGMSGVALKRTTQLPRRGADEPPAMEPAAGIYEMAAGHGHYTLAVCGQLIDELAEEDVELVVHDASAPWGRVAAEWLGLPRLCSCVVFPPPYDVDVQPITAQAEARIAAAWEPVARRWGVEFEDATEVVMAFGERNFAYTTPLITGQPPLDDSWSMVGPLIGGAPDVQSEPALEGLDGRPLVYMALGTHHGWKAEVLRPAIEAVADEEVWLLITTGGHVVDDALGSVPENVRIVPWVAARTVLERASVHINHGGTSSVHEAIVAGVPFVCIPQSDDQHLWAHRVAALGVGIRLPTTPAGDEVRHAIRTLLADDAPRQRARELSEHLLAHPGESIADEAIAAMLH